MSDAQSEPAETPEVILDVDDLNRLQAQQFKQRVRDALDSHTDSREAALAVIDLLDEDPRPQEQWTQPMHSVYMAALCGCLAQSSGFRSAAEENGAWLQEVRESLTRIDSEIGIFLIEEFAGFFPGKQFPTDPSAAATQLAAWPDTQHQSLKDIEARFADYAADQMLLDIATYIERTLADWT